MLHLFKLLVEPGSSTHFFEYAEEAVLTLDDQVLHLALLDDLELLVTLQREAA